MLHGMTDLNAFATAYVAMWNEPNPHTRANAVSRLWAAHGLHATAALHCVGHEQIAARIAAAHTRFVTDGGHRFELLGPIDGHHNTARFSWAMRHAATNAITGGGFDFVIFDEHGHLLADYQYPPLAALS
jgi:hypothetical protein